MGLVAGGQTVRRDERQRVSWRREAAHVVAVVVAGHVSLSHTAGFVCNAGPTRRRSQIRSPTPFVLRRGDRRSRTKRWNPAGAPVVPGRHEPEKRLATVGEEFIVTIGPHDRMPRKKVRRLRVRVNNKRCPANSTAERDPRSDFHRTRLVPSERVRVSCRRIPLQAQRRVTPAPARPGATKVNGCERKLPVQPHRDTFCC
jgi:hypothetical protein